MSGRSFIITVLGCLCITGVAAAQDTTCYIEIRPGTLPIILTVPHGGEIKPPSMLSRRYGVTTQDANTVELSLMIQEEMQALYGGQPHAVICRLHRSKVDCNRDLAEAAQGDPLATAAWKRFHEAAKTMEKQVTEKFGHGLTLDIHGHRHEQARVELGYLVTGRDLNLDDSDLDAKPDIARMSSIRDLDQRSSESFSALLRGPRSLGALLQIRSIPAIPSPQHPAPGKGAYFSGAYDITAHGSREEGSISAIQLECPWLGVRDTEPNQRRFAKALAAALGEYFQHHFQMKLEAEKK